MTMHHPQPRVRATDAEVHRLYVTLAPYARTPDRSLRITPHIGRLVHIPRPRRG
jgi:hypothetical protein